MQQDKYAIYIGKGILRGKLLKVIDVDFGTLKIRVETYDRKRKFDVDRDNIIVVGDIVQFYADVDSDYNVVIIENIIPDSNNRNSYSLTIKDNTGSVSISKENFLDNFISDIKFIQYYDIQELFNNPQPKMSEMEKGSIEDMENEILTLNRDISDLNVLKSFLTPLQFEEKIKINSEIDTLQKQVGKKIFDIAEAEIKQQTKDGSILSSLFENSFVGVKHEYDIESIMTEETSDFFAPNGQPSRFSNEVNFMIRSPQFKSWFGDWQLAYEFKDDPDYTVPCSKIVQENGEPEVYWHGTGVPFSFFKFDTFPAAYFAKKKEYSRFFANLHGGEEGYLLPFFLDVRNPLDLRHFVTQKIASKDFFDYLYVATGMDETELEANPITTDPNIPPMETWMYIRNNSSMLKKISTIFDGIRYFETNPNVPANEDFHSTEAIITFTPHQIKLASTNRGQFVMSSLRSFLLKRGGKI